MKKLEKEEKAKKAEKELIEKLKEEKYKNELPTIVRKGKKVY